MYTGTRKLDRLRACSGSNYGWPTDSLVTGPDNSHHRFKSKACSGSNCGWSAASLTYSSHHGCKIKACSRHNYGWFIRANTHVGKQNRFCALRTRKSDRLRADRRTNLGWPTDDQIKQAAGKQKRMTYCCTQSSTPTQSS